MRVSIFILALFFCVLKSTKTSFVDNTHELVDLRSLSKLHSIDANSVTVNGLSAGGYFAVQYHVAHSSSILGAGVTAGGPYYCAQGNSGTAVTACMTVPSLIVVSALWAETKYAETLDSIDSTTNLKASKVFLFSGSKDTMVKQGVMKKLQDYYGGYVDTSNIQTQFDIPAEHSWVTVDYGNACGVLGSPYINKCGYDYAGESLKWLYGNIKNATNSSDANLKKIDQTQYIPSGYTAAGISMDSTGYVYTPTTCNGACKVQVVLHGCQQGVQALGGLDFVKHTGLNEYAEANGIILLYPQIVTSDLIPLNPEGCWDWWGYTGVEYATRSAPQIETVKAMVDALTAQ